LTLSLALLKRAQRLRGGRGIVARPDRGRPRSQSPALSSNANAQKALQDSQATFRLVHATIGNVLTESDYYVVSNRVLRTYYLLYPGGRCWRYRRRADVRGDDYAGSAAASVISFCSSAASISPSSIQARPTIART
jgi:hypothetical protein